MKYQVEVQYLASVKAGRCYPDGEQMFTKQYNRLRIFRQCSAEKVQDIKDRYREPRFRVHTWEVR